MLQDCSAWVPPTASGFKSTHCRVVEYKATGRAELAELQLADILVGHHGAGLTSGYFMRPGTSTVEVCRAPVLLMCPPPPAELLLELVRLAA
jgi:hypothetical protein